LYAFLFCSILDKCPAHFTLLDLIIVIIFGKECKLRNSSVCRYRNCHSWHIYVFYKRIRNNDEMMDRKEQKKER
jgi:hypothetical protein